MPRRHLIALAAAAAALAAVVPVTAALTDDEPLDPAHNLALPCEAVSTPGLVPRSARDIVHLANVCGFVGTDMEFQSRLDASGEVRDFAFVGTMGAGTRIFDVTDPAHPVQVGGYLDPGWQNDVQVRGDTLVLAFDWLLVGATVSECLKQKHVERGSQTEGGVDVVRLEFDPATGRFATHHAGCYLSEIDTGGAHTITLHPSGAWLSMNTSFAGIEVVDLRGPEPVLNRILPTSVVGSAHDTSFSRDGNTMYVASPGQGTYVVDVTNVLEDGARQVAFIPNNTQPGGSANPHNTTISHQSDTSSDGRILVFTDERGGGLNNTACNTSPEGVIGGAHFWALEPVDGVGASAGASPATPQRLGTWLYPNPLLALDPLEPVLAGLGRTERGCTIHVFRNGGNGSAGPGPIEAGFDGVSRLSERELVTAHYGAGVWHVDFSGPPSDADGITEDPRTDWGNTRGWNVMPAADTWSAKEYKGYVYAGDMARGFDVYAFGDCADLECIALPPTGTPGKASGGGRVSGELAELAIVRGTTAGGTASFGFGVELLTGALVPTGDLTFVDHGLRKKVKATAIDSFHVAGTKATFTGRATVDGVPGVRFVVEVEDLGEPGTADTFRIVLGDGYGAGGVLLNGNIQVESASVLGG
ncbi:MAG TPA: post-COAP-1 domain-containing protein [Gaiellaceae bacterium]|nr:post-COAP-1 domain-containing protein [Gaiellaceae bacterium]